MGANYDDIAVTGSPARLPVIGRLSAALSTFQAAREIAQLARNQWKARTEYVTTIDSTDGAYEAVMSAVLKELKPDARRAVEVVTGNVGHVETIGATPRRPGVGYRYASARDSHMTLCGHRIRVSLDSPERDRDGRVARVVRFYCQSGASRNVLHEWIERQVAADRETKPRLFMPSRWDGWESRADLPSRDLSTVVLDGFVKETVVGELDRFLAAENDYARLGIPWHLGMLFHGPPGTGKTSLARALAGHYRMSLYYLPLSDMRTDTNLIELVAAVPARSMLLLEDVDVATAAKDRDDTKNGASLAGLLNSLDGVFTPHGLVTVMTTNHRDVLDEAVVRPGRVDVDVALGLASIDVVHGLWELAFPGVDVGVLAGNAVGLPPAEIVRVLHRNLSCPESAARELSTVVGV